MSSSAPADAASDGANAAVVREGIDFASAKNFWQTRAARAQSRTDLDGGADNSFAASTVATADAGAQPLAGPSTPVEKYPGELEEEVEAATKPAPSELPPPAPSPTAAPAGAAASALTRMTSFRSKFFSGSATTGATTASEQKENDTSPSAALPSISVPQLPDMSAWKDKMKMSRPMPSKMSFSFKDLSSQLKTSLSTAAAVAVADPEKVAMARNNIQRPTQKNTRRPSGAAGGSSGSAFGELVVAEVLAAKDLSAADFFQGESDPYIVVRFQDWERRTTIVKNSKNPVFNERFVFWIPSPPSSSAPAEPAEPGLVSVVVMNKNLVMSDMHLGEVHIALDVPLNEAFDEWYPLVKENGEQQGHVRVGVRRMELTSAELQQAAQALAANNRSLNDDDLAAHGAVLPDLWYGFAEAAEPLEEKASQTEVLATKLNDLSRRFIGIEITSTELTADGKRRDIF